MRILLTWILLTVFATPVFGEVGPLDVKQKKSLATDVIEGTVVAVYTRDEARRRDFVNTHYVVEIAVTKVEKTGKKSPLKPKQVIYAYGWRAAKRPRGWAGGSGHYISPSQEIRRPHKVPKGRPVRVYLRRGKTGRLQIVYPNGFETLPVKK